MKSTREKILETLLNKPNATIGDLAEAVDINTISVRHHLTNLQADGLIHYIEERHGVGRPRLIYSLTESGLEHFPTRYMNLTIRLLEQLKNTLPKNSLEKIFTQMAKDIAADQPEKIKKYSIEQKLDYIKGQLNKEGFLVEWEKVGEDYRINEVACPFYHVGQSHPEVCTIDQALISTILSIPTEKIHCVLNGDVHCTYVIKHESLMEKI